MAPAGALRVITGDELGAACSSCVRVPVIGRLITAGFPSPADDFAEEAIEVP